MLTNKANFNALLTLDPGLVTYEIIKVNSFLVRKIASIIFLYVLFEQGIVFSMLC